MKELGGETGVLVGLDLPSVGGGTSGQLSESEDKHLRLREKQLISGSLNRIRTSFCHSLTGMQVPRKAQQRGAGV